MRAIAPERVRHCKSPDLRVDADGLNRATVRLTDGAARGYARSDVIGSGETVDAARFRCSNRGGDEPHALTSGVARTTLGNERRNEYAAGRRRCRASRRTDRRFESVTPPDDPPMFQMAHRAPLTES